MGWCTSMKLNVMKLSATNVIPISAYVEKIASESATVTAKGKRVEKIAPASVCKRGCGRLYKDWYEELVCPICGYHEYEEENIIERGERTS